MRERDTLDSDNVKMEKTIADDLEQLGKKAKYLEKQFNEANSQLRDIVSLHRIESHRSTDEIVPQSGKSAGGIELYRRRSSLYHNHARYDNSASGPSRVCASRTNACQDSTAFTSSRPH